MVGTEFFGNFDLASAAIWMFWIFFALLVYYLQTENMREGYPLQDDDGNEAPNQGPFPVPSAKTFKMPHGRADVVVPSVENEEAHDRKDLALARTSKSAGSPYVPTGDPMVDGVGPASWAPRADAPELDGHGHVKIRRMSSLPDFAISAGNDPRGMPVMAGDKQIVGEISDIWVDVPEALIRFLEVTLDSGGTRLIPMNMARVKGNHVKVRSIFAKHFSGIPQQKQADQITLLEEEKAMAWFAGGTLYASPARQNTVL